MVSAADLSGVLTGLVSAVSILVVSRGGSVSAGLIEAVSGAGSFLSASFLLLQDAVATVNVISPNKKRFVSFDILLVMVKSLGYKSTITNLYFQKKALPAGCGLCRA
jgi:hypothetical protein